MPEIERKWVISSLPDQLLKKASCHHILQGYVITYPGELRVRTDGVTYWITAKSEGTLVRDEWEVVIPEWTFEQLFATTAHHIEKLRYQQKLDGYNWEIDIYLGALQGLITVEIECQTINEAQSVVLPPIFSEALEVTEDNRYKNKNLAIHGLPR